MEYQNGFSGRGGGRGRSASNTSSSSDLNNNNYNHSSSSNNNSISLSHNNSNSNSRTMNNINQNHNWEDPMQCWWESVSKARSRIQTLLSLLPNHDNDESLSSLADSDLPSRSLLDSHSAYSAVSSALSGSGDDPLCQWLYDTFQQDDADLRLVVLSFVPVLAGLYLTGIHAASTVYPSMAGFEAVLLALYSAETKSRGGKPLLVSIPSPAYLAHNPSLYHNYSSMRSSSSSSSSSTVWQVGVMCPPLEPQVGIKSTKRGAIIGVAFHCFYTHISHMPPWSKIDLCRFASSWAGDHCPCTVSFHNHIAGDDDHIDTVLLDDDDDDDDDDPLSQVNNNNNNNNNNNEAVGGSLRIPLPWEVLQPMLRIIGHCLLAPTPLISDQIKDAASLAIARLYARASHDLSPQAILATRNLLQLHQRACATAKAAAIATSSHSHFCSQEAS